MSDDGVLSGGISPDVPPVAVDEIFASMNALLAAPFAGLSPRDEVGEDDERVIAARKAATECEERCTYQWIDRTPTGDNDDYDFSYQLCPQCTKPMTCMDSEYKCFDCAVVADTDNDDYGVSNEDYNSHYSNVPKLENKLRTIRQKLALINDYNHGRFSPTRLMEVSTLYNKIQAHKVHRAKQLNGILGALIISVYARDGIRLTGEDVASCMGIETKKIIPDGMRALEELTARGIIERSHVPDETINTIDDYAKLLGIDMQYRPFLRELVSEISMAPDLGVINRQLKTRCIACCYWLIKMLNLRITEDTIDTECDINRDSYVQCAKFISENRMLIKRLLNKYGITPRDRLK
jgi:hypothetical protein